MRVKLARGMKVSAGTNGRRPKYDAQYTPAALIWLRPIFHRTFAIRHSRGVREKEEHSPALLRSRLGSRRPNTGGREKCTRPRESDNPLLLGSELFPGVVLGLTKRRGGRACYMVCVMILLARQYDDNLMNTDEKIQRTLK